MIRTRQKHPRRSQRNGVIHRLQEELRQTRKQLITLRLRATKQCAPDFIGQAGLAQYGETLVAIQRAMLLQQLPTVPGLDLAVHSVQSDRAGGDFYDIRNVAPNRWARVIADVSGHGLAAAAILVLVHALGSAVQGEQSPGAALALVNKPLAAQYLANTGKFVTAFVGLYDAETRVLTYSLAGHPPPRLVRGNEVRSLGEVSGYPLGIDQTSVYRNETLQLLAGDRLVLFTDGIPESTNAAHDFFGDERLDAVLRTPASTAAELRDRLVNSVRAFRTGRPAGDDETCVVAMVECDQRTAAADVDDPSKSNRMGESS